MEKAHRQCLATAEQALQLRSQSDVFLRRTQHSRLPLCGLAAGLVE
jgi:hypothetical protein